MVMDSGMGSWLDLEQPAPQRRLDTELRCDGGETHGAWCLCSSRIESGRADNANWGSVTMAINGSCNPNRAMRQMLDALRKLV